MADNAENRSGRPGTFDPAIQTENIAFDTDQLIGCSACGRMNPPNRFKCLYCARELGISTEDASSITPVLRKLDVWERGFNLITLTAEPDVRGAEIAKLLSAEMAEISAIIDAATPLPLVRVETASEATLLKTRLGQRGVACMVVTDVDLLPDRLPVRLRGIELTDGGLVLQNFNTDAITAIRSGDLALMVTGQLTAERVDKLEKKRRGGKTKLLDEVSTASAEPVLDIYVGKDPTGHRVYLTGFNFSCLGADKGLIAGENMLRLAAALRRHAPNAKFVDNYSAVKQALGGVWELESRNDPQGLKRSGFGRVEFGSVTSSNNLKQFTKYSRLQRFLL